MKAFCYFWIISTLHLIFGHVKQISWNNLWGATKFWKSAQIIWENPAELSRNQNFLYQMQILVKIYVTVFPMCLVLLLGCFMIFLIRFYIYFDFWTRNTYFLEQFVGHDKILKNSSNHMEKPSGFEVLVPKKQIFFEFWKN